MAIGDGTNQTIVKELILLGFGDLQHLDMVFFLLFLVIYIFTMVGNILIIALVALNPNLHTPMYFFLGNLSCLETFDHLAKSSCHLSDWKESHFYSRLCCSILFLYCFGSYRMWPPSHDVL